jgi:hypothetical protein
MKKYNTFWAKSHLKKCIKNQGLKFKESSLETIIPVIKEHYVYSYNFCDKENDGDMLLFQWGDEDFDDEPDAFYVVDFTRQFSLEKDKEYLSMKQLEVCYYYNKSDIPSFPKSGNKWSTSFEEIELFLEWVTTTEAYLAIQNTKPVKQTITYSNV